MPAFSAQKIDGLVAAHSIKESAKRGGEPEPLKPRPESDKNLLFGIGHILTRPIEQRGQKPAHAPAIALGQLEEGVTVAVDRHPSGQFLVVYG
jgi:hypothetical protein